MKKKLSLSLLTMLFGITIIMVMDNNLMGLIAWVIGIPMIFSGIGLTIFFFVRFFQEKKV